MTRSTPTAKTQLGTAPYLPLSMAKKLAAFRPVARVLRAPVAAVPEPEGGRG